MHRQLTPWTIALGLMSGAAACGGTTVPVGSMAEARAAIRAAEEVGVRSNPRATLQVRLAREQVTAAQKMIRDGEEERANLLLLRAAADAELALALARETEAEQGVRRAQAAIRELDD